MISPLGGTRTSPSRADESLHRCDKSIGLLRGSRNNGQEMVPSLWLFQMCELQLVNEHSLVFYSLGFTEFTPEMIYLTRLIILLLQSRLALLCCSFGAGLVFL